jgi:hypothetical protein
MSGTMMFGSGAAETVRQEGAALRQLVSNEIGLVREQRQVLLAQGTTGYVTIFILLSCIIMNLYAYLSLPDYFALFIAASLFLHMGYFITLLVPIGEGTLRFPAGEIQKFFSVLYHTGIIPATDRFTRILLDVFFMNSRTLCFGFFCLFSLDVLFTGAGYYAGIFSSAIVTVILFQVLAFLVFYILLWRLEPGTTRFKQVISGMKDSLAGRRYPVWLIAALFGAVALLVLLVILSLIILLPGMTVKAFLSRSGLGDFTGLFLFIGLLAASQYFIVRFFHGIASTAMAARVSEHRIRMLQTASEGAGVIPAGMARDDAVSSAATRDALRNAAESLLESRIYRLERRTLFGAFPVYLVNPDFSVIFDEEVIAVITGYLKGAGSLD